MSTIERNTTLSPSGSIVSVQVGHVAALGARQVPSAFVKRPISGRVMVIATIDRPNPNWSVARLNRLIHGDASQEEIAELAALRGIASDLRLTVRAGKKGSI